MKIEVEKLREMYAQALEGKLPKEACRTALNTLDDLVNGISNSSEAVIEELANDPKYSHGIYGCFGGFSGHYLKEVKVKGKSFGSERGSEDREVIKNGRDYMDYTGGYGYKLFGEGDSRDPNMQFKGRIMGKETEKGYLLDLVFCDMKGDHRGGENEYMLKIPAEDAKRIIPLISQNSSVLVRVFQKVFPKYDRSEGKLCIDENNSDIQPWVKY